MTRAALGSFPGYGVSTTGTFERVSGWAKQLTDALAWPLRASHYLELFNPLWSSHVLQAKVVAVWDETSDTRTLTLEPGHGFRRHRAGQFLYVTVALDGKQHTRCYSISSEPEREDGRISITVKAVPGGRVSQHLVRHVQPGEYLTISLPQGEFVLAESAPVKGLFLSAGSGITPLMSMLRSLSAEERLGNITHIHYAPGPKDVIFAQELMALALEHPRYKLHLIHTREGQPGDARFSASQLARLCPDFTTREAYVCGPESLLGSVEKLYAALFLTRQLHVERFTAALTQAPSEARAGQVSFAKSQVRVAADGRQSLLLVAEEAGLNPQHGCRMGICHACDATLSKGCARDLRTGEILEPGQRIQLCVCAPVGDAEVQV